MEHNEAFREAMARMAGAVTILTASEHGVPCGLTATAVCSLSTTPTSIVACINAGASAHDTIVRTGSFGVNLLAPGQAHIARRFAGQDGIKGAARFEGSEWTTGDTGVPLLVGAAAALDCRIVQRVDGFSHSILIGVVEAVLLCDDDTPSCLIWHGRSFRQPGDLVASAS